MADNSENPNFLNATSGEPMEEDSKQVDTYLDQELITFEILTRIPADSLEKSLSCVCKQWRGVIHNPFFHKLHNSFAKSGILQCVTTTVFENLELRFMDLEALENNTVRSVYNFPKFMEVLNVCNGLILFKDKLKNLYVKNPRRKRGIVFIPSSEVNKTSRFCDLVYAPCSDKYKVVNLYYNCSDHCFEFKIQTLGSSACSIRKVNEPRLKEETTYVSYYTRCCVNGVLYIQFYYTDPIITLDIGDERTMHILESPNGNYLDSCLVNMGDEIRFVGSYQKGYSFWGLKERKWVGEFDVIERLPGNVKVLRMKVIGSLDNGEVLVFDDYYFEQKLLVLYYVKERKWKVVNIDPGMGYDTVKCCRGMHFNSLVSVRNLC